MIANPNNRRVTPVLVAFLKTFKEGKLLRKDVYSYPALYRLMDLGLVEFDHDGPTYPQDVYRLTESGNAMHAEERQP